MASVETRPGLVSAGRRSGRCSRIECTAAAFCQRKEQSTFPADITIDPLNAALFGGVWYKVILRFEIVNRPRPKNPLKKTMNTVALTRSKRFAPRKSGLVPPASRNFRLPSGYSADHHDTQA